MLERVGITPKSRQAKPRAFLRSDPADADADDPADVTTLLDPTLYPAADLVGLYARRWRL
jgi:hypothetical protein